MIGAKIKYVAICSSLLFASTSAQAQNSNLDQCLSQAEEVYLQEMNRCFTYPFHDGAERDYCAYGAGLTHDLSRQSCFQSYPGDVSFNRESSVSNKSSNISVLHTM